MAPAPAGKNPQLRVLESILKAIRAQGGGTGAAPGSGGKSAAAADQEKKKASTASALLGAGRATAAAAGALFAAQAGKAISAGFVNQSRGGSFSAGLDRGLLSLGASLPGGELGGAAGLDRALKGAEGDLNSQTNAIAKVAGVGAISPKVRELLAQRSVIQNLNLENDRKANSVAVNAAQQDVLGGSLAGTASAAIDSAATKIADAVEAKLRSAGQFLGFGGAG